MIQVAPVDTTAIAIPPEFLAGTQWSLLDMLAQAGGFQWPILAVLVAGLMTLARAAARLVMDKRASQPLYAFDVETAGVQEIAAALDDGQGTLLAKLLARMVTAWSASPELAELAELGHEARTVLDAARAAYARTQRLVAFLSSTAGGIGLLGTLVGIYALFSAETRDGQTIFAGIAIAVVSTLLGIIVSIILEFIEALMHWWVGKNLEAAESWATSVRYRLMDLRK